MKAIGSRLTRREVLSFIAGLATPSRAPAQPLQAPHLEGLTEGPVFLETPGNEPRALDPVSKRVAGATSILIFSPADAVSIRQAVSRVGEHLLRRSFEVYARRDTMFNLSIPYDFPQTNSFYSWRRKETSTVALVQDTGELDRTKADSQLFPFAGSVANGVLTGLLGDCPGLKPELVDSLLIRRIQAELAHSPSFSESIHTRTGEQHGNILYGANAVYLWLRRTIRERLGQKGPDPVVIATDQYLRDRRL